MTPAAPPPVGPVPEPLAKSATETPPTVQSVPVVDVARVPLPGEPGDAGPAVPPGGSAGPVALLGHANGDALALPFAAGTGAAAFRCGGETVVVFDERRPIDLGDLLDSPAFGTARVQLLPAATVLRFDTDEDTALRLEHTGSGWTLTRVPAAQAPAAQAIRADIVDGRVRLNAAGPSAVVAVPDPATEAALFVGTQKQTGQAVPVTRHTPGFALLETLQGVVVEANSDALVMRLAKADSATGPRPGFVLEAEGGRGIALDPPDPQAVAAVAAARMTRRWDFPGLPTDALVRRLQAATDAAAAAAPQARGGRRIEAVQAELALGLGAEAHALATLAATDDARASEAPDAAALGAVAAMMAGRLDQADAIDDPRLPGSDELTLWRAVHHAMRREGSPDAAAGFAATLPLLLAYPAALRGRVLPLAVETLVLGGEREAARRLLATLPEADALNYARALLAEQDAKVPEGLKLLDRLAQSPDRRERARAGVHAAELRLHEGMLTAAEAGDTLDKLIYAWRGDGQELALRLRVADLRAQAGDARRALAVLRETGEGDLGQSWPDQRQAIRSRMSDMFRGALAQDVRSPIPPLDLVALVDENPDLLPEAEAGRTLAARLADRLAALDLPRRAAPVLQKLMEATPPGAARAELGARLAASRLEQGDAAAALAVLTASAAEDLPPTLKEARTITFARATAARGALGSATATLAALDSAAADDARASLLEAAKDWPGAVTALTSYAARAVPADGTLADGPAHTLLRLASAAAQAGDEALLARLHAHDAPRMPAGKLGDMFRVLTESPVQGVADLPRAAQEVALARGLPAALRSLQPAAPTLR